MIPWDSVNAPSSALLLWTCRAKHAVSFLNLAGSFSVSLQAGCQGGEEAAWILKIAVGCWGSALLIPGLVAPAACWPMLCFGRLSALPGRRRPSVRSAPLENPASWPAGWRRVWVPGHPSSHPIQTCPADCPGWVPAPHTPSGDLLGVSLPSWSHFDKVFCCWIKRTGNESMVRAVGKQLSAENRIKGSCLGSGAVLGWSMTDLGVTQAPRVWHFSFMDLCPNSRESVHKFKDMRSVSVITYVLPCLHDSTPWGKAGFTLLQYF